MTTRNDTALGTYRTLEGTGLTSDGQWHQRGAVSQWAEFRRAPDGWAAYDAAGVTWRITEAEARVIMTRVLAEESGE